MYWYVYNMWLVGFLVLTSLEWFAFVPVGFLLVSLTKNMLGYSPMLVKLPLVNLGA